MTAPLMVSELDVRKLLGIISDDHDDLPAAGLPRSLLRDLTDVVRCDVMSFFELDSGRQATGFMQDIPAGDADEDDDRAFWAHYWDCDPCSYPDRSGDLRSITKVSDFYSTRQWHGTGMYREYFRGEVEHEMMLCLPAGPRRTVRLIFFRGAGADFSERDRGLLALLRPHLHEAYRAAERRRSGTPELTRRQRELLHLVADGYTNAQIGRRLGLAEGTVRKHLENIFARLQVSSRTAAVIKAFPDQVA
ncbi:MAG TPA: helix-turn-helix transcriptional regulator [Streptosporangiaceae bacterium]|nr:helix-turn-helix transcriptional regulator [Streptosporangiaceae bacterium]